MKIAMVMAGDEEGGLEKHVEELVAGLAERGHEVTWIAHPKYANRVRNGARFEPVDLSRSRRHPLALWTLWRALRRNQPDIIHSHGGKALAMTSSVRPYLRSAAVTTVHGRKKRHRGLSRTDAVISPNRQLSTDVSNAEIHIVYHGIQPRLVSADRSAVPSGQAGPAPWLAVGRLVQEKGFDVLIKAMTLVPGNLQIAGEGPERRALEAQIRELGLEERVLLLGHRDDIAELMQQCQGLVISSRREGFSYVFAEALFNRCPVVSTDVPIPNEVLPPNLICPADNVDALAELMNRFRPDPALIDSLFVYAATHLTLDSMLDNTLAVYQSVLDRRAS
jgi:glycosyltransferase involved in cell wall biosynthesis